MGSSMLRVPGSRPELVLFDAGGTLVLISPDRFNRLLAKWNHPAVEVERLFTAHYRAMAEFADLLATGERLEFAWWVGRFFELAGVHLTNELADGFGGGKDMWNHPIPGALETVEELRRRGYRVAVVSNSDGTVAEALEIAGFGDSFEIVIDSTDVGISKPDPGIFELALRHLGVSPDQAWYVGDSHYHDAGGAQAAGLAATVLIDPLALAPPGHLMVGSIRELAGLLT